MGDIRRAYRRWLAVRLAWLLPGLALAGFLAARFLGGPSLPVWIRIPSLTIAAGALFLLAALGVQSALVVRSRSAGDVRAARLSRRELRAHRATALLALAVLLSLSALPLLFEAPLPPPPLAVRRPAPPVVEATVPEEQEEEPLVPVASPPPAPGVPQVLPEIAAAPSSLNLIDEPAFPTPSPVPPREKSHAAGRELLDPPQRPGPDDYPLYPPARNARKGLDRGGLPDEGDASGWPLPELRLDITIIPESRKWVGALYEVSYDLPVGRDDSMRVAWFSGLLSDEKEELEPTLSWQRATLEYVRRCAGYTRHAPFDVALRLGVTIDRVAEHESRIALATTPRISPWIGLEAAVWQDDGFGLVLQGGQSVAARITGESASVTDLRILIRFDWSESVSFQAGYRIFSARLHDHGLAGGGVREELEQTFSGPVAGISVRF